MKIEVEDDMLDAAEEAAMNVADMDVPLRAYLRAALAAVIPLVQAQEREACADVVDSYVARMCDMSGMVPSVVEVACSTIAATIRARTSA